MSIRPTPKINADDIRYDPDTSTFNLELGDVLFQGQPRATRRRGNRCRGTTILWFDDGTTISLK